VAGGDERGPEARFELVVGELGGGVGDLAHRTDRERSVVVRHAREVRAMIDRDPERRTTVVARLLGETADRRVVAPRGGEEVGEERKREAVAELVRDRRADEPARVLASEPDELGGRGLGQKDEVGFALPVRRVEDEHRLAVRERPQRRRDLARHLGPDLRRRRHRQHPDERRNREY